MPGDLSRPFIQARTQNQVLNLQFDMGFTTADIALGEDTLKKFNDVIWTHTKTCSINFSGEKECYDDFILPSLTFDNQILKSIDGVKIDDISSMVGTYKDSNVGILGLALIKKFKVELNYPKKCILLFQGDEIASEKNHSKYIQFTLHDKTVVTEASINNKKILLAWDTGAISILRKNSIPEHLNNTCPVQIDPEIPCYLASSIDSSYLYDSGWFYLMPFPDTVPFNGFIGSQFFHKHKVTFDFKKQFIKVDG